MSFAENLKFIRKKHNITQEQLADILSVSRQNGNQDLAILKQKNY